MPSVDSVVEWLVSGVSGAKSPVDVLARMNPDLVAAGVPIDRCEAFVRTLHPHIAGRSFVWAPGQNVVVSEVTYAYLHSPAVADVFRTSKTARFRLDGFTDAIACPMAFITGQVHAITFATRRAGGFTDDDVRAFERVLPPLSRIAEIFALARTATNLLNTYVGHDAGERILAGHIQRGDTAIIRAAIWFSDLRGFTSMSSALAPTDIIAVLNDIFDCQVPAIEKHAGEVLKFMGDGMLAIFPIVEDAARARRCDDAIAAVRDAFASLDTLNGKRAGAGKDAVRFGVGLHVGEIAYGNIGGSGRLDFTCIGPAVNLAARLESLTGKLGKNVVVSEDFSRLTSAKLEPLGPFELKGVPVAENVFAPIG